MTDRADPIRDEDLVAYLDGELSRPERSLLETRLSDDPTARSRLDELRAGGRPFAEAFDAVLEAAPSDRLQRLLAQAVRNDTVLEKPRWTSPHFGQRLGAIAAAVLIFIGGALVGVNLPGMVPKAEIDAETLNTPNGWRATVADYLNLYTRDTLADIPDDAALREEELAFVGDKLSLDLSTEKVALPDLALKRSQIYSLEGRPLAQIIYLPKDGEPVAFCIIQGGEKPEQRPTFESREGKNVIYWSTADHKFMLFGDLPKLQLESLADSLAARVV